MTDPGAGHLTTSRVNRLLRPLRNKCNCLAALPKPATTSCVTHLKTPSDSRPPLLVLCRSIGTKKLTLDRRSADEFELARRIYAVCDAFKNIVHAAYGQPCKERIPSLGVTCTLVIGENMPASNTVADSGDDAGDENGILNGDDIYEMVPPHYRRFLVVSHALSMILTICDHHYTLVTILLDHCLSFGLAHESTRLLNIIISQAFLAPDTSSLPPVTHPAHTNYLIDLHAKWSVEAKLPGLSSGTVLFTTSAFCHVVFNTLSRSTPGNSHILWTSEVFNKFLHTVQDGDIDSYINIIHMLCQSFWIISGSSPDFMQDDARLITLRDKLSELISTLFDLLFTQHNLHSSLLTPSRIQAVVDVLCDCHAARLLDSRMTTPGFPIDLLDIAIVFTTLIFVTFRKSIDNADGLLAILGGSSPVPTTFSKLVAYFGLVQESQAFPDFLETFLLELRTYSSVFHSEQLFALDASLWACALQHFGTSITISQKSHSALVTKYKQQLIEGVDASERRCFGGDIESSPVVSSIRSSRTKRTHRGRPSGHWEWEDMVGAWIRKTPIHKKRKIDDRPPTPSLDSSVRVISTKVASEATPVFTPLTVRRQYSSMLSPSSSSRFSEPESRTEDGSEYQESSDKENYPGHLTPIINASNRVKRRSSNFFSLLADAQTNRIVLHSKRRFEPKSSRFIIPEKCVLPLSSQQSRHPPRKQERKPSYRKMSPPPKPSGSLLPSDDSLDLFAYATSSPARC